MTSVFHLFVDDMSVGWREKENSPTPTASNGSEPSDTRQHLDFASNLNSELETISSVHSNKIMFLVAAVLQCHQKPGPFRPRLH